MQPPSLSPRATTPLPAAQGSGTRTRQRRKEARPQELLEAALHLFVEKGLAATRAEDVARLAGVSKGTLYLYYPSKDELFKAVVRAYITQVIVEGDELLNQYEGATADLLRQLAQTWWTRVGSVKAAGLILLILSEASSYPDLAAFYMKEVVEPCNALLARIVTRGIARGEFRTLDVDSVVHAMVAPALYLVTMQHSASAGVVMPAPLAPERFIATQIELLLHGLASPVSPSVSTGAT